jgi:glycosyltransferase involved in cell wall biosynthesis
VGVVLANSDDSAALAAVLRGLVAAPARCRAMAAASRRLALAHSWPAMARQYLDLLQRAAAWVADA